MPLPHTIFCTLINHLNSFKRAPALRRGWPHPCFAAVCLGHAWWYLSAPPHLLPNTHAGNFCVDCRQERGWQEEAGARLEAGEYQPFLPGLSGAGGGAAGSNGYPADALPKAPRPADAMAHPQGGSGRVPAAEQPQQYRPPEDVGATSHPPG